MVWLCQSSDGVDGLSHFGGVEVAVGDVVDRNSAEPGFHRDQLGMVPSNG